MQEKIVIARDLTKSMHLAAAGIAGGYIKRLEATEKLRRLEICKKCEFFNAPVVQCRICKCKGRAMDLKMSVNVWRCPKGKWHAGTLEAPRGYCLKCSAIIEKREDKDDNGDVFETCTNNHRRRNNDT